MKPPDLEVNKISIRLVSIVLVPMNVRDRRALFDMQPYKAATSVEREGMKL